MITKHYRRIQISLLIIMITSLVLMVVLAFFQPASAVDQSGEVTGIVASVIEIEWETDTNYCGGENYNDVCITTSISTPMGSGTGIITVSSNNPTGHFATLQMRNDTNQNNLVAANPSILDFIAPTPDPDLSTPDTWGYYVGFSQSWHAVPRTTTDADTILGSGYPGTIFEYITFGAHTAPTLPTTTYYANDVVFTAAANP